MNYHEKLTSLEKRSSPLEKTLLHFLILHPDRAVAIHEIVTPADFLNETTRRAYQEIMRAFLAEKFVRSHLVEQGIKIAEFLRFHYHTPSNAEKIAREIRELKSTHALTALFGRSLQEIQPEGLDETVSDFHDGFLRATRSRADESFEIADVLKEYDAAQKEYADKIEEGQNLIGLATGFEKLDQIIDGLRAEHLWIVGGYTSSGKTFFSLNIAAELIRQGKSIVFYSLEMSKNDIISRLLSILTGIPGSKIFKGILSEPERKEVLKARDLLLQSGLRIRSEKHNLNEVTLSMIEENMRAPVDCYMLDYLQLVTTRAGDSEYESMSRAAKVFQDTAKRVKAPMIILSQISNEGAKNPQAEVMSFKGAGDIAAAADIALHLYSGEDDRTEYLRKLDTGLPVQIICAVKKNRHGRTGNLALSFTSKNGQFRPDDF